MSAAFLAGVIAGYGIAVPVGAIGVLIVGLSARTSLRVGAAAGLGAATADGIYALVAVTGGAAVAGVIAPVEAPLRWLGAAVLLALAGWTAWAAIRRLGSVGLGSAGLGSAGLGSAGLGSAGPGSVGPGSVGPGSFGPGSFGPGSVGPGLVGPGSAGPGLAGWGRTGRSERPTTAFRAYAGVLGLTLLNPATVIYFAALVLGTGGGGGAWFVAGAFLASASWQLLIAAGGSLIGRFLTGERGRLITALVSSAVIAALALHIVLAT